MRQPMFSTHAQNVASGIAAFASIVIAITASAISSVALMIVALPFATAAAVIRLHSRHQHLAMKAERTTRELIGH